METNEKIRTIKEELNSDIENIESLKEVQELKVKYLGKKGLVTELSSKMKELLPEERKNFGQVINEARTYVTALIETKEKELKQKELDAKLLTETIDISLPSKKINRGTRHPFNRIV